MDGMLLIRVESPKDIFFDEKFEENPKKTKKEYTPELRRYWRIFAIFGFICILLYMNYL